MLYSRFLPNFLALMMLCFTSLLQAETGLEIDTPEILTIVYTIEPRDINPNEAQNIVEEIIDNAGLKQAPRTDAQLFVRVEQHVNKYLLYVDFSREMNYQAQGKCYSTSGFVWGRYAKNIDDETELLDDLSFFVEEFVSDYKQANQLQ
jgi:hypothetical protein